MQLLIEKRLGGDDADPEEVQDLLSAWTDWTDLNDLEGLNGAEKEYYQSLDQPFSPRNNPELDTVDELLHVRGFAELFEGVNLEAAFTIYGNSRTVNLNLASRETMQLLPGLDDELIENIIAYREREGIQNRAEIGELVPFENLLKLSSWVGNNTSNIYTIFAYTKLEWAEGSFAEAPDGDEYTINPDAAVQAYMEIVQVSSFNELPRIYKVEPYGHLPDTSPARIIEYDIDLD
jgi:general secretion pathway protein K